MKPKSDDDRLAALRRNDLWRQAGNTLTMIGAVAVVALIVLPTDGVALTWVAIAALMATGIVAIGLPFFLLRFIDHSV